MDGVSVLPGFPDARGPIDRDVNGSSISREGCLVRIDGTWGNCLRNPRIRVGIVDGDSGQIFADYEEQTFGAVGHVRHLPMITRAGWQIERASQLDRVATCGIDRWLGGVHLQGRSRNWRWDDTRQRVTQM